MASFPFILQAHAGHNQVELAYNGQHLEFDSPNHPDAQQSSGCLPCGPSPSSVQTIRTVEILNISIQDQTLSIAVCAPKSGPKSESLLQVFHFQIKDQAHAAQWQANVLGHVYKDLKRSRHYKVLVNPFGGQGLAKKMWERTAEPIVKAAGCTYDLTYTTHRYHAKEIARDLNIRQFDAIICVSGDGVIHEVINGLMERPDAIVAHKLAIGAIPGEDHGAHVGNATLGVVKGRAMPADLCSVTQDSGRFYSFELQSFGLIADVDLGSEHLRWMGEARFTVSAVGKLLSQATTACELAYIPVETDITKIHRQYTEARQQPVEWADQTHDELDAEHTTIIDKFGKVTDSLRQEDGWVVENDEYITVVGAKTPWISKGTIATPAAQSNDGCIDLLIFPKNIGRAAGVSVMIGVETGEHVFQKDVRYMKVKAFRVSPKASTGYISMDGEHTPYKPYQVEAHHGLISVLSVEGRYARSMK
ncbi:sphinganine kinase lcb4 [Podila humilis]|nr:sphinganine kinase lcb4 [Podila humilis]